MCVTAAAWQKEAAVPAGQATMPAKIVILHNTDTSNSGLGSTPKNVTQLGCLVRHFPAHKTYVDMLAVICQALQACKSSLGGADKP